MVAWFVREWLRFRDSLRWRGACVTAILAVRELFRPILYWHMWRIFTTDISQGVPQSYARDELQTRTYTAQDDVCLLKSEIAALGELPPAEVSVRFERNDAATIAYAGDRPIGYTWTALSPGLELAYGTYWSIQPGEGVRYGMYVIPEFRGRGVQSFLSSAANKYAREHGIVRTFSSVSALNPQSLSLAKHLRRAIQMTVIVVRIKGVNWTIRKAFGAPLSSRFNCVKK
jgi:GNAT superfamily N-acetyltransferase